MRQRVHVIRKWPCGGGMETMVRLHLAAGEKVVALTGRGGAGDGVEQLGLSPNATLAGARRRLRAAVPAGADRLHYNGYAAGWLAPDAAPGRACLFLHSDYPFLQRWLRPLLPRVNACLCVNAQLCRKLGELPGAARSTPRFVLPLPVAVPDWLPARRHGTDAPLVIGYAGRLAIEQKRLDRLPAFLAAMDRGGLDYRMELLGSGVAEAALRRQLAGHPRLRFHGFLAGDAYWRVLAGWKYIAFFSDFEGLPLSLIEGVAAGAMPVYPDFHSAADWPSALGKQVFYPPGAVAEAARGIQTMEKTWTGADWREFSQRARQLVAGHTQESYFAALDSALGQTPPEAPPVPGGRRTPGWVPLWIHHRWQRWRQTGTLRRKGS
jgi:hypothetical protein